MAKKYYVYGNWKMNLITEEIKDFIRALSNSSISNKIEIAIAPQSIHFTLVKHLLENHSIRVGLQQCSEHLKGAYTGEVSPLAAKNLKTDFVLVGHSERRSLFGENLEIVSKKTKTLIELEMKVVFCIGETFEERKQGRIFDVLTEQLASTLDQFNPQQILDNMIIAYEPVWAIGTGEVATPSQANEAHQFIREFISKKYGHNLEAVPLLYGGSVKPENFEDLLKMPHIDGALVGGASLNADSFIRLCSIAQQLL